MVVETTASSIYGTELKNIMERFIQQQVKDRTECVLMTTFHAENPTVIGSMCGTG
jgi:hypothetical protein